MAAQPAVPERVLDGFSFPTSLAFDPSGALYIGESGLPFGGAAPGGRLWRATLDGERTLIASGLRAPVNGVTYHDGSLYVSEGGHPGRISRFAPDGTQTVLLDNLPGPGNYHTNMALFGPDGKLYFSQGAMTNMGVIGLDAYELGWLRRLPHAHDIPGYSITLAGVNIESPNPLSDEPGARTTTGAFAPFGTTTEPGQRIEGTVPATAAVMRCDPDGSNLELVAWGLRNAFGLGFLPDGRLIATDQGADDRGSRPVGNIPDLLFAVEAGKWYGWPDFVGGDAVTDERYAPTRGPRPTFVLANHDELPAPERPLHRFQPHACAVKFDIAPAGNAHAGQLFVALFGDEAPMTAPEGERAGRSVVRVDPADWSEHEVAAAPMQRPIDAKFGPDGALYVLDFGQFEMNGERGVEAVAGSGGLWRLG